MFDPRLSAIFAHLRWRVHPEPFVVAALDPREIRLAFQILVTTPARFAQLVIEPDTLTLAVPESSWRTIRRAFPTADALHDYRAIAFEVDLPPDLVGFMATISTSLAQAGVSLLAVCSYARDYVLVRDHDLPRATQAIEALVAHHQRPPP